jgi:hypothetical protein
MTYSYKGLTVSEATLKKYQREEQAGMCPFCKRTGLSAEYGNRAKHIKACKKRPQMEQQQLF